MSDLRERVSNITALAKKLGYDYSHVHAVLRGAVPAGPRLAIAIETDLCGVITRSELRPDLWPQASTPSPSADLATKDKKSRSNRGSAVGHGTSAALDKAI